MIDKVDFNYETRSWNRQEFKLPYYANDYVLLTPKDILTKDDTWINRGALFGHFNHIVSSMENNQLRSQLNDYFKSVLPRRPSSDDRAMAIEKTIEKYPEFVDYFIRLQEKNGKEAEKISTEKVSSTFAKFVEGVRLLSEILSKQTTFYSTPTDSYVESLKRINYLKQVIEKNDGYKVFYHKNEVVGNEKDLHVIFRLAWFNTVFSVDSEVNNGRGPVDYKISKGFSDATLVEFKLASNSKLEYNLNKQLDVYLDANQSKKGIKVILYFNQREESKVKGILKKLKIENKENVILIDARKDNKISASNVK